MQVNVTDLLYSYSKCVLAPCGLFMQSKFVLKAVNSRALMRNTLPYTLQTKMKLYRMKHDKFLDQSV